MPESTTPTSLGTVAETLDVGDSENLAEGMAALRLALEKQPEVVVAAFAISNAIFKLATGLVREVTINFDDGTVKRLRLV